ncbi:MAG TPA: biotin/lipoyl-containing protein [Candidatus Limnocylindrales bacterium]|nr:biotin/lipoyl-containing protein [Candidatus Limnocylindrales bacterium]
MPDGHPAANRNRPAATPSAPQPSVTSSSGVGPAAEPPSLPQLGAIDALIDRLVPALTAKLGASHLGELEVRHGDWKIRLRRPATSGSWNGELRRAADRHGRAIEAVHRIPTPGSSNGTAHAAASHATGSLGAGSSHAGAGPRGDEDGRRLITSPAVGVFRPNARATVGSRVREADVLGHIDVLGVREDVLASSDGLVGEIVAEDGTPVEYGQPLLVLTLAGAGVGAG